MGKVISIKGRTMPATWENVRAAYDRTQQMGYQAVEAAAEVGRMLIELKEKTEHGEFLQNASRVMHLKTKKAVSLAASRLMRLAEHWPRIAKHKPDSQAQALALIPSKPRKKRKDQPPEPDIEEEDEEEVEEKITPKRYYELFHMRVITIHGVVRAIEQYSEFGKPTQPMIAELRATAQMIETVAQKLETRK